MYSAAWQKYVLGFFVPMKRKTKNLERAVDLGGAWPSAATVFFLTSRMA